MKKTLATLFVLIVCADVFGQYYTNQNKVWAFGRNAGIDFTSGSPLAFHTGINNQTEGCSSVSSEAGSLLFYTDGKNVYNHNGVCMPHGAAIVPFATTSSTQAALIVPVIGNSDRYYVFSLEQWDVDTGSCHLAYSIVDMSLDSGRGDLVSGSIGVPLASQLSEKMIAIPGDTCNIWLLTHNNSYETFYAYNISAAGIGSPISSGMGTFVGSRDYTYGVMKASHDRQKIVCQYFYGTELYDFDVTTGLVSNRRLLDSTTMSTARYGAEFSPQNTKLYTNDKHYKIFQYDITATSTAAIIASKVLIDSLALPLTTVYGDLKLGPDGKIYIARADSGYLDRIDFPNLSGSSCGYTIGAVTLLPGTYSRYGLPNTFFTAKNCPTTETRTLQQNAGIFLFPNPATTELTISAPEKITHLSISNIVGQKVYHHEYNAEMVKVDISNLPTGIYFVKVNGMAVRNFVKQ